MVVISVLVTAFSVQASENLTSKKIESENDIRKEQVLSTVEDQSPGNMPIKKITQEDIPTPFFSSVTLFSSALI